MIEPPKLLDTKGSGKLAGWGYFMRVVTGQDSGRGETVGKLASPRCHPLPLPLVIFCIHLL